jgi:hypothetical protein
MIVDEIHGEDKSGVGLILFDDIDVGDNATAARSVTITGTASDGDSSSSDDSSEHASTCCVTHGSFK